MAMDSLRLGAAGLLLAITVCVLFTISHVSSSGAGSALCMPGLSIRCEPGDCGSQYVRCGRNQKRQEVPADKVCYKGALISIKSRMHSSGLLPHDCREKTYQSRNSTAEFDLKACNCRVCSGTEVCVCYCKSGGRSQSKCTNNGSTYVNPEQARCCLPGCKLATGLGAGADLEESSSSWYWSLWNEALDFGRAVISPSLKQVCESLRDLFTFPRSMEANACCTRVPECNQC